MKSLLIFSGGMDSATLLWQLLHEGKEVEAISFDYGQRHRDELIYAKNMINYLNEPPEECRIKHDIVDIRQVFVHINSSSLTNPDIAVPDCHYTAEAARITVVPNRNQILLSIAVGIAAARNIKEVYYAAHAGDHFIYDDCRPEFLESLQETTRLSTLSSGPVEIKAPFINLTKADIVGIGLALGIPYKLTRSCYNDGEKPCGTCPTCIERIEAFTLNGVTDPSEYMPH